MGQTLKVGACSFALVFLFASEAGAKQHARPTRCAAPPEVTAIAASSIQQELMVAALTCNQVDSFNAFQTSFGPELRASDRTLMRMFQRLYGAHGEPEYHAFKTRLANNSEIRSIHGNRDFCTAAGLVFQAALAANKPSLEDFVSGVQVEDPSPVNSCEMQVTLSLQGAMAAPALMPREKPSQFEDISETVAEPAAPPSVQSAVGTAPAASAQAAATVPADSSKKKGGWLSGIFN